MDEFDIYDDLDEFHEQEEKKSKELLALQEKYDEAVKAIEIIKLEKKDLRKKIRIMELNLQSLLDTAKAEMKRKDKVIAELRKEKDDMCFRRNRIQQKLPHVPWRENALSEENFKETAIGVDFYVKENRKNPFKQQPSSVEEHFKVEKEIEQLSDERNEKVSYKMASKTRDTNANKNDENAKAASDEGRIPSCVVTEKRSLHAEHYDRTGSTERFERDFRKHKYDSDFETKKHDSKSNRRHGNDYPDISKRYDKCSENSSHRSVSNDRKRYDADSRKYSEKKKSSDKRHDDHYSSKNNKNEEKDRSRSSERIEKSHKSKKSKEYSRGDKEKSSRKHKDHKHNDRLYKSHGEDDKSPSRRKNQKRRRSCSTDDERYKKRHHSHRDKSAEKVSESKRSSKNKIHAREESSKSDDISKRQTLSISSNDRVSKYVCTDEPLERSKSGLHTAYDRNKLEFSPFVDERSDDSKWEKFSEIKNAITSEVNGIFEQQTNDDKEDKFMLIENQQTIKNNNILEPPSDNDFSNIKNGFSDEFISIESHTHRQENTQNQSNITQKMENKTCESSQEIEHQIGGSNDIHNINSTEQVEKTITQNGEKLTDCNFETNAMKQAASDNGNISKSNEHSPTSSFLDRTLTDETGNGNVTAISNETSKEIENISSNLKQLTSKVTTNVCNDVAIVVKDTRDKFIFEAASENDVKMTEEHQTRENLQTDMISKNQNTPKKFDPFEVLFGFIPSPNKTSENDKDVLNLSINSSTTTSPSLYTDVSQTPSRHSPKIVDESTTQKNDTLTENNNIKENSTFASNKLSQNNCEQRSHETSPDVIESKDTLLQTTSKTDSDKENGKNKDQVDLSSPKLDVQAAEYENLTSNEKRNDSKDNIMCADAVGSTIAKTIEGTEVEQDKSLLNTASGIDKNNSVEESPEHDMQTICLVDLSDDEIEIINYTSPPRSHENHLTTKKKTEESIDQMELKEIDTECSRLKRASSDHLEKIHSNVEQHENSESIPELVLQEAAISPKIPKDDNEKLTAGSKSSNNMKTQSIENPSIVIDLDESSSIDNLTLSSDDETETLANLKKKYDKHKKPKIEILENIQLPSLFQSVSRTNEEAEIHNETENNVLDKKELNGCDGTNEDVHKMCKENKYHNGIEIIKLNHETQAIIDIIEGSPPGDIASTTVMERKKVNCKNPLFDFDNKTELRNDKRNETTTKENDCGTEKETSSEIAKNSNSALDGQEDRVENVISKLNVTAAKFSSTPQSKTSIRLTEYNEKILQDKDKCDNNNDSMQGILSENKQESISISRKIISKKQSPLKSPLKRKISMKDMRTNIPRSKRTPTPMKIRTTPVKSKSKSPPNYINDTIKTPIKRKRLKSRPSSLSITNTSDNEEILSNDKSEAELSSSAEVKAMLIDGKSPQIANDTIISSSISTIQDAKLDELDKNMEAIFQSPAKYSDLPCSNSTALDITIEETVNCESSSVTETCLNRTSDSSFESKRSSLGNTEYIYERVSENVVNLFITRRRTKKRAKLEMDITKN